MQHQEELSTEYMLAMRYGSICSGVEAASLAWEPLGWQPEWFAEIEPFPSAVLAHRWPNIPNHGDMTLLPEKILSGDIPAPDILVGGTPCQAFSVAGRRESLQDDRGNLTLTLIEIINAIDLIRIRNGQPPCILIWENVPGVLNTQDNAFGCFLGGLAGEQKALISPRGKWTNAGCVFGKRKIAWRVLDAKYFGVPQRRRRVFVVASAGRIDPSEILFERTSLRRDTPPCNGTQQNVTAYIESSFGAYRESATGGTVKASGGAVRGGSETLIVHGQGFMPNLSYTLTSNDRHAVQYGYIVRRLTPIECERLQGMPDNHTRIPWRGKPAVNCPDGPRYKAIGNSMAVPVMRWVGGKIQDFLNKKAIK